MNGPRFFCLADFRESSFSFFSPKLLQGPTMEWHHGDEFIPWLCGTGLGGFWGGFSEAVTSIQGQLHRGCLYVCLCVCVCLGIYPEHACPGGRWEGVRAGGRGRGVGYPGLCLEQVSEVICHEEEEWWEQLKCVGSIKGEGIHQGRICQSGRKKNLH